MNQPAKRTAKEKQDAKAQNTNATMQYVAKNCNAPILTSHGEPSVTETAAYSAHPMSSSTLTKKQKMQLKAVAAAA